VAGAVGAGAAAGAGAGTEAAAFAAGAGSGLDCAMTLLAPRNVSVMVATTGPTVRIVITLSEPRV